MSRPSLAPPRRRNAAGDERSLRPLRVLLTAGVAAVLLSLAISWWRDRPVAAAEAALEQGRPAEAIRKANAILRSRPGYPPAESVKARALVAAGRFREAADAFDRLGIASAEDMHAFSKSLLAQGRWESARPLLEEYVGRNPTDADALHELTACYANLGKSREALATAAEFAKQPGQEAKAQVLIGTIHRDLGNERAAEDAYAKVLALRPDATGLQVTPAEFLHAYAEVLLDLGEPARALPLLERSLAAGPTAAAYSDLGSAQEQLGRTDEAEKAWRAALERDPGDRSAREGLAGAALRRRDPAAALELLAPLASSPAASTAYLFQRSHTLAENPEEAARWKHRADSLRGEERVRSTVDRVLRDLPDTPWAAAIRAYRAAEKAQWSEAEKHLAVAPINEKWVDSLRDAVRRRGPLPPLTDLPMSRF